MPGAFAVLKERGFVSHCSDEEGLAKLLDQEQVTFYIGFDPTASSLHVGHMVQLFAMAHLQKAGHRPIALIGGGTSRIGDPSGKTEMRKILPIETIKTNADRFRAQISRFLDFSDGLMLNNADWLADLNYIEFLREIGRHFSVNRMLSFETYKMRLDTGLSFIEFNYQILQAYDYLVLYQRQGCRLQMGGDDQWGNIVAGMDLIRRVERAEAFALTTPLVTRADGQKMGKTEKGALFLDPELVPPYEFYQYWLNVPDADVEKLLCLFTYLPIEEVRSLGRLQGREINTAKERLAMELTSIVHGKEEAESARSASRAVFYG
ncbi:MAG: tyrosine--tRNA ligase, partial [Spirochaetia bacterium]